MLHCDTTSWDLIRGAAAGAPDPREEFASRYAPVLRGYFRTRWKAAPLRADIEDAVQECFVDCFRDEGALSRVDAGRPGGFRAFLYGVARNIAARFERAKGRSRERFGADTNILDHRPASDRGLSEAFDRSWARAIMREAVERLEQRAEHSDPRLQRRIELLRRRFIEDLPIREIAREWDEDPAFLHHEFATARIEFKEALVHVVGLHHPGTPAEVERECIALLELLQ